MQRTHDAGREQPIAGADPESRFRRHAWPLACAVAVSTAIAAAALTHALTEPSTGAGLAALGGLGVAGGLLGLLGAALRRDPRGGAAVAPGATPAAGAARALPLLAEADIGLWECDLASGVMTWSPALRRMLGAPDGAADRAAFLSRVHEDDRALADPAVPATADGRFARTFRVLAADGVRWLHEVGQVAGQRTSAIVRDVTADRTWTDAVAAAQREAERAKIVRARVMAAASHDLRQPVQSMVLFVDLLRGILRKTVPASELGGAVDGLGEALGALDRLLEPVLEISQIDAGVVSQKREPVDVNGILDRLVREYRPRANAARLELRLVPTAQWIDTDPAQFERILRALLDNALAFTGHGRILIGCRRHGGRIRVCVGDSGVGIAPEEQTAIFEEFHKAGPPVRPGIGTGLGFGLAIAQRLADKLQHGLEVRSRPGHGSLFWVEAPAAVPIVRLADKRAAAKPPERPKAPEALRMELLVLVIEDDPIVRSGIRAALRSWGHESIIAESAEDALRQLGEPGAVPPDIILADYRLRDHATGTEAIAAVRERINFKVPGLILTGDTEVSRLAEVERAGFQILHKPVSSALLRQALEAAHASMPWTQ